MGRHWHDARGSLELMGAEALPIYRKGVGMSYKRRDEQIEERALGLSILIVEGRDGRRVAAARVELEVLARWLDESVDSFMARARNILAVEA